MEPTEALRRGGVVGAGGAGFPTYVKLSGKAEYLVANGAECEPLLQKDRALLLAHPEEVRAGIEAARGLVGAGKAYLAVKEKHTEVFRLLREVLRAGGPLEIVPLPDVYPVGDEIVLVYETLARVVPPGELPAKVGAVVQNVETLYNVGRALAGLPVTDKYLTVTGRVGRPATLRVPVGTPFRRVLALAGGPLDGDHRLLVDGPMMGDLAGDAEGAVTKTTSALIVLPAGHPAALMKMRQRALGRMVSLTRSVCTSCSQCSETCPRGLLGHPIRPHLLMRAVGYHALPEEGRTYGEPLDSLYRSARYCVSCGTCDLVCPMGLSPRTVCAYIKKSFSGRGEARSEGKGVSPARPGRRMPTARVLRRLGLEPFQRLPAPLAEVGEEAVDEVRLLLRQGIGKPAVPLVKPGQEVRRGEMVAGPPEEGLGVALHASIGGRVASVTEREIVIVKRGGAS